MPRYFFHTRNGDEFPDELGTELADDDAARAEAILDLRTLISSYRCCEEGVRLSRPTAWASRSRRSRAVFWSRACRSALISSAAAAAVRSAFSLMSWYLGIVQTSPPTTRVALLLFPPWIRRRGLHERLLIYRFR